MGKHRKSSNKFMALFFQARDDALAAFNEDPTLKAMDVELSELING